MSIFPYTKDSTRWRKIAVGTTAVSVWIRERWQDDPVFRRIGKCGIRIFGPKMKEAFAACGSNTERGEITPSVAAQEAFLTKRHVAKIVSTF